MRRAEPGPEKRPRPFVVGAFASFLFLLLCTEALCRLAESRGFWYGRVDVSGSLTSRPECEARLRWAAKAPRSAVLLGDSVLGPTALLARGEGQARAGSLAGALARDLGKAGVRTASLGADGLLPEDLAALATLVERARPSSVLLAVNVRMLASLVPDGRGGARPTREFLSSLGPPPRSDRDLEPWISSALARASARGSCLFRTSLLLRTVWFVPSQRDFWQRRLETLMGRSEDRDLEDAALGLKVAGWYREAWAPESPALSALARALSTLRPLSVAVVLSPQNPSFAGVDELPRANRELLRDVVTRVLGPAAYRDLSDRYPPELFIDHCHLTAEGNARLAAQLAPLLLAPGRA